MNIIARLEYELTYYDSAVQRFKPLHHEDYGCGIYVYRVYEGFHIKSMRVLDVWLRIQNTSRAFCVYICVPVYIIFKREIKGEDFVEIFKERKN